MTKRKYEHVTVGWRVMGTVKENNKQKAFLHPISRTFATKSAAIAFALEPIKQGIADAYVQEVIRPERKEIGIA